MIWQSSKAMRIGAGLVAAVLMGTIGGTMAQAHSQPKVPTWSSYDDEIADANSDKANAERELDQLEGDLAETNAAIQAATVRLAELEAILPGVQEEYRVAQERLDAALTQQKIVADKLAAAKEEDAALTIEIADDNARIEELREVLADMARAEYQDGQQDASLSIFFGATSSQEFIDDIAYRDTTARVQANTLAEMEEIAAVNLNRSSRQTAVRAYIEELKEIADVLVIEAQTAQKLAEEKKAEVEALLAEAQEQRDILEAQRQAYLDQQAQIEADRAALEAELTTLWQAKLAEEAVNGTGSLERGFLSYPTANPYVTSSYGYRIHPIYGYRKLHSGIDFRAYCGTPILAAADGKVEWAKYRSGYGNQVMIYNGVVSGKVLYTSYNHLTSFAVSSGQEVDRGQVVGYSGTTGTSTACHLHFEVYVNGATVDPATLLP